MPFRRLRHRRVALALIVTALAGVGEATGPQPAVQDSTKAVLMLDSEEIGRPAYLAVSLAFRHELTDAYPEHVNHYVESLDFSRFQHAGYADDLHEWFLHKYEGRRVDVIVPITPEALTFAVQNRPTVWPGAKIVFAGIEPGILAELALPHDVTGITAEVSDFPGTIALALGLVPDTRRIAFVGLRGPQYREFLAMSDRFELVDLTTLPFEEIKRRLAELPPHTIVFFDTLYVDPTGKTFIPRDALEELAAASAAPIFSCFETYVGVGSVGGMTLQLNQAARELAQLTVRVLRGADPSTIPISATRSAAPVFDWRLMRKWGMNEAALPPDSLVLFREPTFWELYRWYAIGGLGLIGLQAGLIGGLLVQRTQRRRANAELQCKRDELAHATRAATMGELAASLAHELNQPLAAILSNAEAAQEFLGAEPPDLQEVRDILADIRADDQRAGEIIRRMRSLLTKQPMEVQAVDLARLTSETLDLVKSRANLAGVQLWFEAAQGLRSAHGDRIQIQQVILNLLVNAIEATAAFRDGSRVVRVRVSRDSRGWVWVAVRDAGPGIPQGELDRVFEPFFTTKSEGMGMGLAIARSIVESHGGRIVAENNPWGGAHVAFTIPLEPGR
jgi:signal transduction histidine kinase